MAATAINLPYEEGDSGELSCTLLDWVQVRIRGEAWGAAEAYYKENLKALEPLKSLT